MAKSEQIILFDGVCNFCNGSVNFLIRRDPNGIFKYAPLQSKIGQKIISKYNIAEEIDSIILLKENNIYIKSDAVIEIIKQLSWNWQILLFVKVFPRKIRDVIYDLIANNRYKWFGKRDYCMIPDENLKSRFLE